MMQAVNGQAASAQRVSDMTDGEMKEMFCNVLSANCMTLNILSKFLDQKNREVVNGYTEELREYIRKIAKSAGADI